jgi:hypothetical protein
LQIQRTAATSEPEALLNAAKFTAAEVRISGANSQLSRTHNYLILRDYFYVISGRVDRAAMRPCTRGDDIGNFPDFAERKMLFAINLLAITGRPDAKGGDRLAQLRAAVDLSFEPNTLRRHQFSVRRNVSRCEHPFERGNAK